MGFSRPDLFRQAGYSEGDVLPLVQTNSGGTDSTTSNSYTGYDVSDMEMFVQWDAIIPDGVTGVVGGAVSVNTSTDEVDVRIHNVGDDETLVEVLGITGGGGTPVQLGPTDYTPTTTDSGRLYRMHFRNGDNATEVDIGRGTYWFGVRL